MVQDPLIQEILDEWEAKGEIKGEEKGREEDARDSALIVLRARFGEIPEEWEIRVRNARVAWCQRLMSLIFRATDLTDLRRLLSPEEWAKREYT